MVDDAADQFEFTNSWFESTAKAVWDKLIPQIEPTNILEVGSYEGKSTCYLILNRATQAPLEIHCVDTWTGGLEHNDAQIDMSAVERRFRKNIKIALSKVPKKVNVHIHRSASDTQLARLLSEGKSGYFDFIYIDGSHQAPDVLCDAVLGFRLLKVGGTMVFDDYLWVEAAASGLDPVRSPKLAIDSFTNVYCRKLQILSAPLYQLYVKKISD